jgi:hypothetical protein
MPDTTKDEAKVDPLEQKGIINYRITTKQKEFLDSDIAAEARKELKRMDGDPLYNTRSLFTPMQNQALSFVDRHMKYLSEHPKLNPTQYLTNLRLMTRLKR